MAQDFSEDCNRSVTCDQSYENAVFDEHDLRTMEAVAWMSHTRRQNFTACIGLAIDIDHFFGNLASSPQVDVPVKASSSGRFILLTKTIPISFDISNASPELAALMPIIFNRLEQIVQATVNLWQAQFKHLFAVMVPTPDELIVRFFIAVGPSQI